MTNRRKYMRIQTSLDAQCFSLNGEQIYDQTKITDMCREGAHLVGKEVMKQGDRLSLEVSLPKEDRAIPFAAEVTWSVFGNGVCHSGVRLVKIDPVSRFKILDYAFYATVDQPQ